MSGPAGLREAQIALRAAGDAYDAANRHASGRMPTADEEEAIVALRRAVEDAVVALAASWTVEDTCQVGNPDPTPVNALRFGGSHCGATDQGWICTRYPNHPGRQHVAGDNEHVKHVWPWTTTATTGRPAPAGIAESFTPAEREALVRTAGEAVCGSLDCLTREQFELAEHAYVLLQQELGGDAP